MTRNSSPCGLSTGQVSLGSAEFYYQRQGRPDAPPLLFLHGFLGNVQSFAIAKSYLAEQFCCLSVDLPGHGKTRVVEDREYAMPQLAHRVIQLLDSLQIQTCQAIGYSLGGRLALYLALHFPQRFTQVVLESASPGLAIAAEQQLRRQQDEALAAQLETQPFSTWLHNWYHQPLFTSLRQHPDFEQLMQQRLQNCPEGLARSLRYLGTGSQPSLWEQLPWAQVPLLLLVGEKDYKFRQINQAMAAQCPMAQLMVIPGCGHNIHTENAQAFVAAVQTFLNRSSSC